MGKLLVKVFTVPNCTIWVALFTWEQYFLLILHRFLILLYPFIILLGIWNEWRIQCLGFQDRHIGRVVEKMSLIFPMFTMWASEMDAPDTY